MDFGQRFAQFPEARDKHVKALPDSFFFFQAVMLVELKIITRELSKQ